MNFSLDTNLFEKRVFCWKDGGRERETCVSNITINANAKIQQYVKFQVCGKRHGGANLWSWDKHDGCQRHDMRMCLSGFHCFEMISISFEDGWLTMITFLSGVGAACTGVCNACQLWWVRGEERCKVGWVDHIILIGHWQKVQTQVQRGLRKMSAWSREILPQPS